MLEQDFTSTPLKSISKFRKNALSAALAGVLVSGVSISHAATITVSGAPSSFTEGDDGNISINISVSPDLQENNPCTVSGTLVVAASDSSATEGDDFTIIDPNFTISSSSFYGGSTSVSINVIDDNESESDETIVFSVDNITNSCLFYGGLTADTSTTVTIIDNDEEVVLPEEPSTPTINNATRQVLNSMGRLSLEGAKLQSQNLSKQLSRLRSGLRGNDLSSLNLKIDGQYLSGSDLNKLLGAGAGDTDLDSPLGTFVGGTIQIGEGDETDSRAGYDFHVDSFFAGLDYKLNKNFILGGAIGYTNSVSEVDDNAGETNLSGMSLGLFTSYYWNNVYYMDAIVSYGQSDYDTSREVTAGSNTATAKGETDGDEITFALNTGYYFRRENHSIKLFGALNYIDANIDSFRESSSNNSITLLNVDDQNQESLTTNLGIEYGLAINTRSAVITPQISIDWEHQYKDDVNTVSGRFIGDPDDTTFNIDDSDQDRDYFNLGLSVSAVFKGGFSAYTTYEIDLGRDDLDLYDISIGARWEF